MTTSYIFRNVSTYAEKHLSNPKARRTYVLTNNADMHAIGKITNIVFHGIIDQKRFSNNHRRCEVEVDCALGLF